MLVASEWNKCTVLLDDAPGNDQMQQEMSSSGSCGGGIRTRNVSCVLSFSNQPVDISFCVELPQLHKSER